MVEALERGVKRKKAEEKKSTCARNQEARDLQGSGQRIDRIDRVLWCLFIAAPTSHSCRHRWSFPIVAATRIAVTTTIGMAAAMIPLRESAILCREPMKLLTQLLNLHHGLAAVIMLMRRRILLLLLLLLLILMLTLVLLGYQILWGLMMRLVLWRM